MRNRNREKESASDLKLINQIINSFSIMEANKRLFSPLSDRVLIADGLLMSYIFWYSLGLNYIMLLTYGTVGFSKIQNSFTVRILTDEIYFWLRTYFPRDCIVLIRFI